MTANGEQHGNGNATSGSKAAATSGSKPATTSGGKTAAAGGSKAAVWKERWRKTREYMRALGVASIPVMRQAGKELKALWQRVRTWVPRHRRATTISGIAASVALLLMVTGIPGGGSPERQVERLTLSGKDLFLSLCDRHMGTQRQSRVAEAADRGSSTNVVVVPTDAWQTLSQDQRNSIGSWLNAQGGRWEIRVGASSPDNVKVLDPEPVVTSREWNQQMK